MSFSMQNSTSLKKYNSSAYDNPDRQTNLFSARDLQKTIAPHNFLCNRKQCECQMCTKEKIHEQHTGDINLFQSKSKASTFWLKKLLDSLTLSGAKTLHIHLPDLLFVVGDSFQTFQTSRKDGRLIKLSGTTPLKSLFPTLIRYTKEYKYMLQLNFNEKMLESIDPDSIHLSYFQKFVPSHFHDGMPNVKQLQRNRRHFKRYILHQNKKFEIQQIQEHKMNAKQPFCIVKYTDGNFQLFNQTQFQVYMLSSPTKLKQQISFVQSYIKYKLQTQSIYYSQYTLTSESTKEEIDKRAERQVMVLLGALHKFDQGYLDIDTIDQIGNQLMQANPKKYVKLMTYKIVHYLNMTSRIYIDHIKIKWIMNDLGNIYLQEIMEFQMSQIPRRLIKFRLPPKDEVLDSVSNTRNFAELYREMKKRKYVNTQRIKKMVKEMPPEEIQEMMKVQGEGKQFKKHSVDTNDNRRPRQKVKKKMQTGQNFRTLDTAQASRRHQTNRYSTAWGQSIQHLGKRSLKNAISLDRNQCQSACSERLSVQMNKFFTINPSKQEKNSSKQKVLSSKTQKYIKRYVQEEPEGKTSQTIILAYKRGNFVLDS